MRKVHQPLRIWFPLQTADDEALAVPSTFLATGLVRHRNVRTIQAKVTEIDNEDNEVDADLCHFLPVSHKRRPHLGGTPLVRWVALFEDVSSEGGGIKEFLLSVEGRKPAGREDEATDSVRVWINTETAGGPSRKSREEAKNVPIYDFPPDNYVISGSERDYFVAYGTIPENKQVIGATLGGVAAAYYDSSGETWWAEFTGLAENPGPTPENDYVYLLVTNSSGTGIRNVRIEDDSTDAPGDLEFPAPPGP